MSRILKYKESLHRFIKDKSCLLEDNDVNNTQINSFIYNKIKDNDLLFPILLLTVMNNQNKKNHISMQGYYLASCIEFLIILLQIIETKNDVINILGQNLYLKICTTLLLYSNKSLQQNIESVKSSFQSSNFINIIINSLNIFNNSLKIITSLDEHTFDITDKECNNNIIKWYLKDNNELIDKFKTIKMLTKDSMQDYIEKKYVVISELSISLGWIMGGGDIKEINKLKKSAKYFAIMYKLSKDFENLENDIRNSKEYCNNYIINYGLQDGYELFLTNKQKFIEESMIQDTYTNTIKEIIDNIENNVDIILDQTSPDLKSTYSSYKIL